MHVHPLHVGERGKDVGKGDPAIFLRENVGNGVEMGRTHTPQASSFCLGVEKKGGGFDGLLAAVMSMDVDGLGPGV